ncbi:hypothetical protein [Ruminococcus sp.]|uniref:hypothetical protein n=1 Tax=Ruminococcus sp. TaxID=41978 RepID=UPI00396707D4
MNKDEKQSLLDIFGKILISEVRDRALKISMNIVMQTTVNNLDLERYKVFTNLNNEEKEAMCDLLSETITDTIYRFLEMFEDYSDIMELDLIQGDNKYDIKLISEKMGSEIACYEDDGWIQRFSKIGRFVL